MVVTLRIEHYVETSNLETGQETQALVIFSLKMFLTSAVGSV